MALAAQILFIGQTLEADAMEALFTSGDLVLVDFYKEDCKACLQHAPHFAAVRVGTSTATMLHIQSWWPF